eukprot:11502586-Alexandrium_andersonii.AAC.1
MEVRLVPGERGRSFVAKDATVRRKAALAPRPRTGGDSSGPGEEGGRLRRLPWHSRGAPLSVHGSAARQIGSRARPASGLRATSTFRVVARGGGRATRG